MVYRIGKNPVMELSGASVERILIKDQCGAISGSVEMVSDVASATSTPTPSNKKSPSIYQQSIKQYTEEEQKENIKGWMVGRKW